MNMKMEEHQDQMAKNKKKKGKKGKGEAGLGGDDVAGVSDTESMASQDGPPSDYEQML